MQMHETQLNEQRAIASTRKLAAIYLSKADDYEAVLKWLAEAERQTYHDRFKAREIIGRVLDRLLVAVEEAKP